MRRVCIFCGSNTGARGIYAQAARAVGTALVRRQVGLVFGGGCVGLMGIVADTVLAAGGEVIGVIPEALVAKELAHQGVGDLRVVSSMHERKALMADLADAFVALPGGYGTFEEFCEVVTWAQLGLHRKPCGLLNVGRFYDPLLAFFDHAVVERFVRPEHRALVLQDDDPEGLLERLARFHPPLLEKWIDREMT